MEEALPLNAIFPRESDGEFVLDVQEAVYSREALLRTCYWFTDRCYLFVALPCPGVMRVHLRPKHGTPTLEEPKIESVSALSGEFANALLDNELRTQITARTSGIRELIIARALSEIQGPIDPPSGELRDPVGVSRDDYIDA